jgi:tetratricopeptide (TPR) repeat protein
MARPAIPDPYETGLTLSRQHRHAEAIEQYEQALAARPDDPRVLFALGNTARALGMAEPAESFYRRVLALDPQRVEAIVNLANLLRGTGQFVAAQALLAPALARSPQSAELWLTLGSTFREMGDAARAEAHYREALALHPDYPQALGNLADLLADRRDHDAALALYDRTLAHEPDNAQARLNRAVLLFLMGKLKDGWRDYGARLKIPGKAPMADHRRARWTGGTLKRKRLLVTAEQGVGDQIMFASLIPDLSRRAAREDGHVVLECEPRLVDLFARSFPDVTVHGADIEARGGIPHARYGWLKQAGGANAFIEMGSVAKYLRGSIECFGAANAYLKPDPMAVARFGAILETAGPGPFIGVCWRSGKTGGGRALQYAPRDAWAAFIALLPGTVVSVQYDAREDEVDALAKASGKPIVLLDGLDQKNQLDQTAALLSSLDAVVSAPTAVSWLAAGTGVDTYKVLYDTSWTAFGESHEPFAPSCKLMMPSVSGDWADVFDKTLAAISARR